jgi:hypothetical protein
MDVVTIRSIKLLGRLKRFRYYGVPLWMRKLEQVKLVELRQGRDRFDLFERYVQPIMYSGGTTVPDTTFKAPGTIRFGM